MSGLRSTFLRWLPVAVAILILAGLTWPAFAHEAPLSRLSQQPRRITSLPPWDPNQRSPYPAPVQVWPPSQPVVFVPNQAILELHQVDATIDGPVANVRVKQIFRNDTGQTVEGVYIFPLPKDAAVSDFQLTVNGETLEGRLLPADQARAIYESIVRRRLDPALLQYLDRGLFQANVFPIPPGETRTLEFTYDQVLTPVDELYRFNYPLMTRHLTARPVEKIAIDVTINDQPGLRTLYSPNYPSRIERTDDSSATVSFETTGAQPQADFDLYFGSDTAAVGASLLSYKPAGEDGYFLLLLAPGVEVAQDEVVARDILLVVDVSGSMQGDKIAQAKAGAQYVVDQLNPEDRFNVISFSTGVRLWEQELQPATAASRKQAAAWIDKLQSTGSTDINRALLEALAQFEADAEDAGRPAYILFLTDGQPTQGETEPARIVDNARANRPAERTVRLFTFGLGYDVNTDLLAALSRDLGGRDAYVEPDTRVDEAISAFYSQISTPVLSNVKVDLGDEVVVEDSYPYPLPDLFAGEQLVMAGRYREGGTVDITPDRRGERRRAAHHLPRPRVGGQGRRAIRRQAVGDAQDRRPAGSGAARRPEFRSDRRHHRPEPALRGGHALHCLPGGGAWRGGAERAGARASPAGHAPGSPGGRPLAGGGGCREPGCACPPAAWTPCAAASCAATWRRAETVRQEEAVRYLAGRTFRQQGFVTGADGTAIPFWVDTGFRDTMEITNVEFGSAAYFDLLDERGMGDWLSLSPEMLIVTGEETAVRVTTTVTETLP